MSLKCLAAAVVLLAAALSVLPPAPAAATELDSIYVKVRISPQQMAKWLRSPMRHMHEFDDWKEMTEEWDESWPEHYYTWDYETMWDMVKDRVRQGKGKTSLWGSPPYIHYDVKEQTFTFAQLMYGENYFDFMLDISAYRTLAEYKDTDGPDFLVIYPFLWEPGCTDAVIMEIGRGYTKFHTEKTAPPEFAEFIQTANGFFDAQLEKLEE